jgi:hypothetical protein
VKLVCLFLSYFEKVIIGHEGSKSRRAEKFLKFPPAPQFSRAREPEKRISGASEPPIKTLRSCEPSSLLYAAEVDSPFPRLHESLLKWLSLCHQPPRLYILHNPLYTLCGGDSLCVAFTGKKRNIPLREIRTLGKPFVALSSTVSDNVHSCYENAF